MIDLGTARRPMRIMFSSNGPHVSTGYGNQTALVVPRLAAMGHTPAIFAWYGLAGAPLNYTFTHQGTQYPVIMYPVARDGYGNDMIAAHADQHKADIVLSLIDAWVLDPAAHGGAKRWVPWFPIDSWPIAPRVLGAVKDALRPIVYSRHGERMAHDAGLDVAYVPHGVETDVFCPGDQAAARAALALDPSAFWVLMVAANKGEPSRKAFPQVLHAFAHLARRRPDARLYLHTALGGDCDIADLIGHLGINDRVTIANQYLLSTGGASAEAMVTLYRAADVLLSPSLGEGFGIPILEAQACGTPVIVGGWTAMTELCFGGYAIEPAADHVTGYGPIPDPWWHPLSSYWQVPRVGQILEYLERAYTLKGTNAWETQRSHARAGALAYDADLVARDYWRPVLDDIAERIGVPARDGAYLNPNDASLWLRTGLYDAEGAICIPARDPASTAALRILPDGQREVVPDGWPLAVDDIALDIDDDPVGGVAKIVCREIVSAYGLDDLALQPGDVVLDIGAQVGVVSCYLLKKYPGINIIAMEPQPANAARYQRNVGMNAPGAKWLLLPYALTGDGRDVVIAGNLSENSGGSSIYADGVDAAAVPSTTLARIVGDCPRVALLKMDIEGAEYEVLHAAEAVLRRVDVIAIETHWRPGVDRNAFVQWLCSFGCEVRESGKRYRLAESEVLA